jgi:hypothetical protein
MRRGERGREKRGGGRRDHTLRQDSTVDAPSKASWDGIPSASVENQLEGRRRRVFLVELFFKILIRV